MFFENLYYKEQGDLFGFVNAAGDWLIEPVYRSGDKTYQTGMQGLLLERDGEDRTHYDFIDTEGKVHRLTSRLDATGDITALDPQRRYLDFERDDLFGLYSTAAKRVIIPPIAREIHLEEKWIYIWADEGLIEETYAMEGKVYANEFAYLDFGGGFLTNRAQLEEILDDDLLLLNENDRFVLYDRQAEKESGTSPHLLTGISEYFLNAKGTIVYFDICQRSPRDGRLNEGNVRQGYFDIRQRSWISETDILERL